MSVKLQRSDEPMTIPYGMPLFQDRKLWSRAQSIMGRLVSVGRELAAKSLRFKKDVVQASGLPLMKKRGFGVKKSLDRI